MKFFIVFIALFSVTFAGLKEFAAEFKEAVKEVGNNCLKEVGATKEDLEALLKKEIPTSHEGKCLMFCMHKNWGIQNSEGKLDLDASIKSLAPLEEVDADVYGKAKTIFKTCIDKVGNDADPCITAANLAMCGKEEGEKLGLHENYDL